jgi:hypothetical protein
VADSQISVETKRLQIDHVTGFLKVIIPQEKNIDQEDLVNQLFIVFTVDFDNFNSDDMLQLFDASKHLLQFWNKGRFEVIMENWLGCMIIGYKLVAIEHFKGERNRNNRFCEVMILNYDSEKVAVACLDALCDQGTDRDVVRAIEQVYHLSTSKEIRAIAVATLDYIGTDQSLKILSQIIAKEQDAERLRQIALARFVPPHAA